MRLAAPVLRRMLRTWLAAVCSLMNSVRSDLAVGEPARDAAAAHPARAARGRRAAAAAPGVRDERSRACGSAAMPNVLGELRRLGEQTLGAFALAFPASSIRPYS